MNSETLAKYATDIQDFQHKLEIDVMHQCGAKDQMVLYWGYVNLNLEHISVLLTINGHDTNHLKIPFSTDKLVWDRKKDTRTVYKVFKNVGHEIWKVATTRVKSTFQSTYDIAADYSFKLFSGFGHMDCRCASGSVLHDAPVARVVLCRFPDDPAWLKFDCLLCKDCVKKFGLMYDPLPPDELDAIKEAHTRMMARWQGYYDPPKSTVTSGTLQHGILVPDPTGKFNPPKHTTNIPDPPNSHFVPSWLEKACLDNSLKKKHMAADMPFKGGAHKPNSNDPPTTFEDKLEAILPPKKHHLDFTDKKVFNYPVQAGKTWDAGLAAQVQAKMVKEQEVNAINTFAEAVFKATKHIRRAEKITKEQDAKDCTEMAYAQAKAEAETKYGLKGVDMARVVDKTMTLAGKLMGGKSIKNKVLTSYYTPKSTNTSTTIHGTTGDKSDQAPTGSTHPEGTPAAPKAPEPTAADLADALIKALDKASD